MKFRVGFLGNWALLVIGLLLASLAVAAQVENWQDERRIRKLERVDALIAERLSSRVDELKETAEERGARLEELRSKIEDVPLRLDDSEESEHVIIVSTSENRVYVRKAGETVFEAICSTGKGTTLEQGGRRMKFDTPTGRFRIVSKEQNPVWVPPDWHFVEEARKEKKRLVRLNPGEAVDARTGEVISSGKGGVWGLLRGSPSGPVLKVKGNTVVEVHPDGSERELPPGQVIRAGGAIVMPPLGVSQRRFEKVLGRYRLNIGSGYALHGTLATDQLGRSVSHGCVRVGDADIEKLFAMAKVGDQVIIY